MTPAEAVALAAVLSLSGALFMQAVFKRMDRIEAKFDWIAEKLSKHLEMH